jgi:hypothetical protein
VESCGLPDEKNKIFIVALAKQKKINNPHCLWSNLTKKFPQNFPKSETFAE